MSASIAILGEMSSWARSIVAFIFLSACSHPIMKEDEEIPVLQVSPTPVTRPTALVSPTPFASPGLFETPKIRFEVQSSEWKLISNEDGIQAYQRQRGSESAELVSFRGEAVIPASVAKIATLLNNEEIQKEWVDSLAEARIIERKSKFQSIGYNRTRVPWPFQDRDFLYSIHVKAHAHPPTMLIEMRSIEDARMPPQEGVVRGEMVLSYFFIRQLPGNQGAKMVIEMTVDPRGAIPLWLVRAAQQRWPHNTLRKLRALAMRESIPISPEIEQYFDSTKIKREKK